MKITLDIRKSVEENAASYFEKAKKDKKKLEGAKRIVDEYKKKLSVLEEERVEQKAVVRTLVKKEWFEKFRWFISSDGFLVIGGKDATTNEIVIKKYTEKDDLVFHTDMAGSPFVVLKREGKPGDFPQSTIQEAAVFTAVFSRGWKMGMPTLSVFSAKPEQVTKTAKAGEFLAKGAFYIQGSVTSYHPEMNYAVGVYEGKVIGGPVSAVKKHCKDYVEIVQGDEKLSDVAKQIKKMIGAGLDDIIRALPANCKLKRN